RRPSRHAPSAPGRATRSECSWFLDMTSCCMSCMSSSTWWSYARHIVGHPGYERARLADDHRRLSHHTRRDRQSNRLGGLQVDYKVELVRRHHREIARLRSFQNTVDVARSKVGPEPLLDGIRHEPAFADGGDALVHA